MRGKPNAMRGKPNSMRGKPNAIQCNHVSCICPYMSSGNVEDKCFDQLVNYKGYLFKLI